MIANEFSLIGSLLTMFAGLMIFMFFVGLGLYIYTSLALMTIAKKTKTKNAWLAWIPIANVYLMIKVARLPGLWTLSLLLYFLPLVGPLAFLGLMVWWWWRIAERRNFPGALSLLIAIPIANLIVVGVIAWAKK